MRMKEEEKLVVRRLIEKGGRYKEKKRYVKSEKEEMGRKR